MEEASEKYAADSSSLTYARDLLSAPITSLRILSLWSPRNDRDISKSWKVRQFLYEAYTITVVSFLVVFEITCAGNIKKSLEDMREFTDTLMLLIVTFHSLAKMWPLWVQRRLVLRCLARLDALVRGWGLSDAQRRDAQRRCRRLVSRLTLVVFGTATTSIVLWMAFPFFPDGGARALRAPCQRNASAAASAAAAGCSQRRDLRLPIPAWHPFDTSNVRAPTQYWVAYVFQFITSCYNALGTCACNSLYFGLLHCACASLRSLRAALRELPARDAQRLRDLVRRHQMALEYARTRSVSSNKSKAHSQCKHQHKYVEGLSALLGPMIFVHSCGVSMILCAAVVNMVTVGSLTVKFGAVMTFVIFEMGELFMYCLMGTEIQIQSVACGQDVYCAPWYESPVGLRRSLRLLLLRAQRPARIRGFGYTTLSLELFMSLLRLSYSFYALLRQMEA